MAEPTIKTPFGDALETVVPKKGSSGAYDKTCVPDTPGRDGGMYPELTYDTRWPAPGTGKVPTKTPFKDVVE